MASCTSLGSSECQRDRGSPYPCGACSEPKIVEAYKILDETLPDDPRFALRQQRYDNLVNEKKGLQALREKLLLSGMPRPYHHEAPCAHSQLFAGLQP